MTAIFRSDAPTTPCDVHRIERCPDCCYESNRHGETSWTRLPDNEVTPEQAEAWLRQQASGSEAPRVRAWGAASHILAELEDLRAKVKRYEASGGTS